MAANPNIKLTGKERVFDRDEILVSKTNPKGHLTYTNDVFIRLAGYTEKELLGQPHSIIRHPSMPRCVFKLLWDTLERKREVFAYIVNMSKNGDHYWVLAHVTPTFDSEGKVTSYHSNRRVPSRAVLENTIIPLYKRLVEEEDRHKNRKDGMNSASALLESILEEKEMSYDEFVLSLAANHTDDSHTHEGSAQS
ncbi:MAG: PAS domain-containing protein [Alphaproteobacteria bacterium]